MFKSERPNTNSITPVPLTPYRRRTCRRRTSALTMCRIFEASPRTLLGRTPCARAKANTCRLIAKVLTDVTTGTPSTSATHWPQGATESVLRQVLGGGVEKGGGGFIRLFNSFFGASARGPPARLGGGGGGERPV